MQAGQMEGQMDGAEEFNQFEEFIPLPAHPADNQLWYLC
jgi:hypothetical protein